MRQAIQLGAIFTLLLFAFGEVNGLAQDFSGSAAVSIPAALVVPLSVLGFYAPLLLGLAVVSLAIVRGSYRRGEYRWLLVCIVLGALWLLNPTVLAPLLDPLVGSSADIVSVLLIKFALPVVALIYSWRVGHELTAAPGLSHQSSHSSSRSAGGSAAAASASPSDPPVELSQARDKILLVHGASAIQVLFRRPRRGVASALVRCPTCGQLVRIPVNSIDRAAAAIFGGSLIVLAALVIWQHGVGALQDVFPDRSYEAVLAGNVILALIGLILIIWFQWGIPFIVSPLVATPSYFYSTSGSSAHQLVSALTKLRGGQSQGGRILNEAPYSPAWAEPERYTR